MSYPNLNLRIQEVDRFVRNHGFTLQSINALTLEPDTSEFHPLRVSLEGGPSSIDHALNLYIDPRTPKYRIKAFFNSVKAYVLFFSVDKLAFAQDAQLVFAESSTWPKSNFLIIDFGHDVKTYRFETSDPHKYAMVLADALKFLETRKKVTT